MLQLFPLFCVIYLLDWPLYNKTCKNINIHWSCVTALTSFKKLPVVKKTGTTLVVRKEVLESETRRCWVTWRKIVTDFLICLSYGLIYSNSVCVMSAPVAVVTCSYRFCEELWLIILPPIQVTFYADEIPECCRASRPCFGVQFLCCDLSVANSYTVRPRLWKRPFMNTQFCNFGF